MTFLKLKTIPKKRLFLEFKNFLSSGQQETIKLGDLPDGSRGLGDVFRENATTASLLPLARGTIAIGEKPAGVRAARINFCRPRKREYADLLKK
jgi:hypothetical protein